MERIHKIIIAAAAMLLATLIVVTAAVLSRRAPEISDFTPPAHEENAVAGEPSVALQPASILDIRIGIASEEQLLVGNEYYLYFTSYESNTAWIKLRLYAEKGGEMLAESGLIYPGEHLPALTLTKDMSSFSEEGTLYLEIITYEPETYFSLGAPTVRLPYQKASAVRD